MQTHTLVTVALLSIASGCGSSPGSNGQASSTSSAAATADMDVPLAGLVPNPVYPIEVSIAGNVPLQEAAASAEARSNALDEICKGLDIAPELAAQAPPGGGCPRSQEETTPSVEVAP